MRIVTGQCSVDFFYALPALPAVSGNRPLFTCALVVLLAWAPLPVNCNPLLFISCTFLAGFPSCIDPINASIFFSHWDSSMMLLMFQALISTVMEAQLLNYSFLCSGAVISFWCLTANYPGSCAEVEKTCNLCHPWTMRCSHHINTIHGQARVPKVKRITVSTGKRYQQHDLCPIFSFCVSQTIV